MADLETATLGGGCFWCLEAVFQEMRGIKDVVSGYMGGHVADPDYRSVCTGMTGHAEVVQLRFDPAVISFRDVLDVFFAIHDPTTLDRQGNDTGTQYRSAVFHHSDAQAETARAAIAEWEVEHEAPGRVVTEVTPAVRFYPAEGYHQNYYRDNPGQGYCQYVVSPKVRKFREKFAGLRAG